jgi:uncharacterized membrane protein YeaQ/YmgE (transglycosylase-associated protein family)
MIFIFWLVFSGLVGYLASTKGRSGFGYFLLSAILSPLIGLFAVLILKDINEENSIQLGTMKKCQYCAEIIKSEAVKCKHCGADV